MGSLLHSGSRGDNDTWGKPILLLCLGQGLKLNQLSHALRVGLSPALGFVGCVCAGLLGNEDPPPQKLHTHCYIMPSMPR